MSVTAGDVLQVTLVGDSAGQQILNTFHYGMATVTGTPTQAAVATEVTAKLQAAGELVDKFLGCMPPEYNLDYMWVQFVLDTRYQKSVFSIGSPGTSPQHASTANLAAVITRRGPVANKRNLGSLHLLYPNKDTGVANGDVSAAQLTAMDLLASKVILTYALATLGSIAPILIHGTSKLNAIPITSAFSQITLRTMRRRTVGVGK